jgi:hypothetical protein
MSTKRLRPIVRAVVLLFALPVALYAILLTWLDGKDAATLMLGAVSGASYATLAAMALTLLLRVYIMVALPGIVAYAAVRLAWEMALKRSLCRNRKAASSNLRV